MDEKQYGSTGDYASHLGNEGWPELIAGGIGVFIAFRIAVAAGLDTDDVLQLLLLLPLALVGGMLGRGAFKAVSSLMGRGS